MAESIQHKLSRVRPPRVQITYDVETGNSIVKTELAFVVGVIADLSGNDAQSTYKKTATRNGKPVTREGKPVPPGGQAFVQECKRPEFAEREFIDVNRDNFDAVLADFAPRLSLKGLKVGEEDAEKKVTEKDLNQIAGFKDSPEIKLEFNCMDDFKPDQLIANNAVLKGILDKRNTIRNAYTFLDMNPKVQDRIKEALSSRSRKKGDPQNSASEALLKQWAALQEKDAPAVKAANELVGKGEGEATEEAINSVKTAVKEWEKALGDFVKEAAGKDLPSPAKVEALNDAFASVNAECGKWATAADVKDITDITKKYENAAAAISAELSAPAPAADKITAEMLFSGLSDSGKMPDEAPDICAYLNDADNAIDSRFVKEGDHFNIVRTMIEDVALKDRNLGRILDAILHADDFQKLEASWRGLHYLVHKSSTGEFLRIKVLNATKKELLKSFQSASEFDQSLLFKKVYEETYGTLGGSPYSCLLLDDYAQTGDIEYLQYMLQVAAAAHAPILTAPSSELFGLTEAGKKDSFAELSLPRALEDRFEGPKHIQWKSLRTSEDSRYLNMVMPRVLFRAPYTQNEVDSFTYNELVCPAGKDHVPAGADDDTPQTQPSHDNFLWGNAAYALMERITNAFSLYKWTAAIRGMEGGGLVEDLPLFNFSRPSGDLINAIPTEVSITDRREKELSDLGFIALCYRLGTDKAVFFGGQSVNRPQLYMDAFATANARLSARLPYMLNASRFAHYVKCIMRDKVGSFTDRASVETFLNSWLSNYVLLSDEGSQDLKASYPLREGRVDVTEDESNPGGYSAVMYIRPHFQMEEINVSIRLVAKLPAPAA